MNGNVRPYLGGFRLDENHIRKKNQLISRRGGSELNKAQRARYVCNAIPSTVLQSLDVFLV
jgi:hypothetical protein